MCVCVCERERERERGRERERERGREGGREGGQRERYSWEPISLTVIPRRPRARWAVLASAHVMVMVRAGDGGGRDLRDGDRHLRISESQIQRG